MTQNKDQYTQDLSNDPKYHRSKALKALEKVHAIEAEREASGEWEWVQVDSRTRVYKRKTKKQ